jgi:hypothetical protein
VIDGVDDILDVDALEREFDIVAAALFEFE